MNNTHPSNLKVRRVTELPSIPQELIPEAESYVSADNKDFKMKPQHLVPAVVDIVRPELESISEVIAEDVSLANDMKILGYLAPVPFASGLTVDSSRFTVSYGGEVYAPNPELVPFTTGSWNSAQWNVIQGDVNLRSDLADPERGAAMLARGVLAIDNVSDLLSLPPIQRRSGLRYLVSGYHSGMSGGGGEFYWVPGSTEAVDGGVVHGIEGVAGRFVLRGGQSVTPHTFGCIDGAVLDMSRFEAFNDACIAKFDDYKFELCGDFTVSETLVFKQLQNRRINCNLVVRANAGFETVLQIQNCNLSVFAGKIYAYGVGGDSPSPNDNEKNIRVVSSPRAIFQSLYTNSARVMGVEFVGSNMARCDQMEIRNVGRYPGGGRAHTAQATAYANTGSVGSLSQRTVISLEGHEGLSDITPGYGFVRLKPGGPPYQIKEVSTDPLTPSVSVYPWIPEEEHDLGEIDLCYGIGFYVSTNSNAKNSYGNISPTRCGIGLWIIGPSAPSIESYTGQFCGVDIALGGPAQSTTFSGATFSSAYFEATSVSQVVQVSTLTTNSHGTTILGVTSASLSRMHAIGSQARMPYFPVNMAVGNSTLPAEAFSEVDAGNNSEYSVWNSRMHPFVISVGTRSNMDVRLRCDTDFLRLKGNKPTTFIILGENANGGFSNTNFGITADDGYTINGKSGKINFPDQSQAMEFTALLDRTGQNWLLYGRPLGDPV